MLAWLARVACKRLLSLASHAVMCLMAPCLTWLFFCTLPLLPEVAEHWPALVESCLLRWSLQQDVSRQQLLQQVQEAWDASWPHILSHTASTDTHGVAGSRPGQPPLDVLCPQASHGRGDSSWSSRVSAAGASAPALAWDAVRRYPAAVEAVRAAAAASASRSTASAEGPRVAILSDLPQAVTEAILSELGVRHLDVPVVSGVPWWEGKPLPLPDTWLLHDGTKGGVTSALSSPLSSTQRSAAAGAAAAAGPDTPGRTVAPEQQPPCVIISGNIARLESAVKHLASARRLAWPGLGIQAAADSGAGAMSEAGPTSLGADKGGTHGGCQASGALDAALCGDALAEGPGDLPCVLQPSQLYLAEWACQVMSMHARALSHGPSLGLLSEHELAGMLHADHLDVVMDGIAWR